MAARENQGLVFSVIMLVTLCLVLLVACFLAFRSYQQTAAELATAQSEVTTANTDHRNSVSEMNALKRDVLGVAEGESIDNLRQRLESELNQFGGAGLAADKRNYLGLVEALVSKTQSLEARLQDTSATLENTRQEIATLQAERNRTVDEVKAGFDTYSTQISDEMASFQERAQQIQDQLETLLSEKTGWETATAQQKQEFETQIRNLQTDLDRLTAAHEVTLQDLDDTRRDNFDTPDGRVQWVSAANRTVYINVGSADFLPKQATFSVYGPESAQSGRAEKKGSISVIDIRDRHMAVARITEENNRNPIGIGDLIYTPAWEPGRPEHFAIAGFVDVNGDGESDLDLVRQLIELGGGVVDAIVDEHGNSPEGFEPDKMTINTKYLVLGDQPVVGGQTDDTGRGATAYSQMLNLARQLTVRRMSLNEFLDYIGYVRSERRSTFNATPAAVSRPAYQRVGS